MRLRGIDVSRYQPGVRWSEVADSGEVSFAFVKATEGTTITDRCFSENWGPLRETSLFRGAYHYGHPGHDPEAQAAHFASVVGPLGFRDLPPVLDLETDDGHSSADVVAWAKAFVTAAESLFGRRMIIYTGGFWRFKLGNTRDDFFGDRPLWLAAYPLVANASPKVPASWAKWTFWQYSDGASRYPGTIRVPGVGKPVDQSWFEGDEAALDALCGLLPLPAGTPPIPPSGTAWGGRVLVWPRTPAVAGADVRAWQERMRELGFGVDVDGVYGPQSKGACQSLQRERGLTADGIVGRATWDATFAGPVDP
jgi:lysozyme